MYVYVNGYGLRPFRALEYAMLNNDPNFLQLRGEIRLPKNVFSSEGKKWDTHNYWYSINEIKLEK